MLILCHLNKNYLKNRKLLHLSWHNLLCLSRHTDSKFLSSTDWFASRYRQSNVGRLLPASDYCRERGNQMKLLSTAQAIAGGWEELPSIWLTVAKNCTCRLSFKFHVIEKCSGTFIYQPFLKVLTDWEVRSLRWRWF